MVRNHPSSNQSPTRRGRGRSRSIRPPSANEELNQSTESPQLNESIQSAENPSLPSSFNSSTENRNFGNNFIDENNERSQNGIPHRISFYDNSMRNLSQTLVSSTNSNFSPVLESTDKPSNLNSFMERKLNSIESKVNTILEYLDNLFLANFSKDFLKNNLWILKNQLDFCNFYPKVNEIRQLMESGDFIPINLRDIRYRQRIEQLIGEELSYIRANVVRYIKSLFIKRKKIIEMIDSLKAYLEKEQAHDPTIEEKYFISLLLDRIIDKIKDQLRNASSPFQAFVSSQDDNWKRNQYKALSEKLYRNGENNFLDL